MATRIKAPAQAVAVPQNRDDCAARIRELGDLQRMFERQRAEMNDLIAAVTQQHQPILQDLADRMEAKRAGIQIWCEANRTLLCGENDKLGKTANLVTGEVAWRVKPPSVTVRDADTVLGTLAVMGLHRFIRNKPEVNKEAVLAEPDAVRGIPGLQIVAGKETFSITPFEVEAPAGVAV